MTANSTRAYGTWPSAVSAQTVAAQGTRLGDLQFDQGDCYWLETRSSDAGRGVIVRVRDGVAKDLTPEGFSVRTKVHEYGGGAFWVSRGVVAFVGADDQRIYLQKEGQSPTPITAQSANASVRFCDGEFSSCGSWMVCVREQHHDSGEVENDLVRVDLTGDITVLHSGYDFYASPRLSADSLELAWICWRHPNMPWDATELWWADLEEGGLSHAQKLYGDEHESILQPAWSPTGVLHFVSDRGNWWNIYSLRDGVLNAVTPVAMEFAFPPWVFGQNNYSFAGDGKIYAIAVNEGAHHLCLIESDSGHIETLKTPWTSLAGHIHYHEGELYLMAASGVKGQCVYRYELATGKAYQLSGKGAADTSDPELEKGISIARPLHFNTADDERAFAFYYAPKHTEFVAEKAELPPLVMMIHGGPTGAADVGYNPSIQFWTNRGFAVADVNYRGSTGFGREYREQLKGGWGEKDVADCVALAEHLVDHGLADPERIAIRGGSSGGLTTLLALAEGEVFSAGCSRYGVTDMEALVRDTHKFEARYMDSVVGAYPEQQALYQARSPLTQVNRINSPVLMLQGSEDTVVPPNQAESMVAALDKNGVPHAYLVLEGEGHGFRKQESIQRAMEAELKFYATVFGFEPADDIAELDIKHLNG